MAPVQSVLRLGGMHTPRKPPTPTRLALPSDRDRRAQPRLSTEVLGLNAEASLSPGVEVRVLNVSPGGALLELNEWIRPGTRSTLKLSRPTAGTPPAERLMAHGHVVRCWVNRLAPLRYRAALVFAPAEVEPAAPDDDLILLLERPA